MAADHEGIIGGAEDLNLTADLAANVVVVVAVDDLQRVDAPRGTVPHHPDGAASAAADATDPLEVGELGGLT